MLLVVITAIWFGVGLSVLLVILDESLGSLLMHLSVVLGILLDLVLSLEGLLLESVGFLGLVVVDELLIG